MKRLKRQFVTDEKDTQIDVGLTQHLMSKNSEVSILSLYSHQASEIYSDRKLMEFFEFKMWISVSKDDDLNKLGELPISLQRYIVGKRFLLVIDNVWNLKKERDVLFKNLLSMRCKQGSKVILITSATKISDLPDPILLKILCKLPIRTVFACKCVSKEWCTLIEDPTFPKLHLAQATSCPIFRTIEPISWPSCLHMIEVIKTTDLDQPLKLHSKLLPPDVSFLHSTLSKFETPNFSIVNSCNGLLCVCNCPDNNPIYVWNPITGEYILIPKPERSGYYPDSVVLGFGFSSKANQYGVMRAFHAVVKGRISTITVQVWTLGSRKWRTLGELFRWKDFGLKQTQGRLFSQGPYRQSFCVLYLNGAVHWLATGYSSLIYICSFNFDQEKIIKLSLPESFNESEENRAIGNMRFGVLRDCLYVSDVRSYAHFELWVLKDYNDDKFSWIKEVIIDNFSVDIWPRGLYQPIKYLDNGDLLMFHPSSALVCYNPKQKSFRYFKIGEADSEFDMIPHIPSLIPMKDVINMEGSEVEILNVR
jgi:F-box interacting protein